MDQTNVGQTVQIVDSGNGWQHIDNKWTSEYCNKEGLRMTGPMPK